MSHFVSLSVYCTGGRSNHNWNEKGTIQVNLCGMFQTLPKFHLINMNIYLKKNTLQVLLAFHGQFFSLDSQWYRHLPLGRTQKQKNVGKLDNDFGIVCFVCNLSTVIQVLFCFCLVFLFVSQTPGPNSFDLLHYCKAKSYVIWSKFYVPTSTNAIAFKSIWSYEPTSYKSELQFGEIFW